MTRTLYDIFANAPRGMLPAVAALLCVDPSTLTEAVAAEPGPRFDLDPRAFAGALYRELAEQFRKHGDWSPEGLDKAASAMEGPRPPSPDFTVAEQVAARAMSRLLVQPSLGQRSEPKPIVDPHAFAAALFYEIANAMKGWAYWSPADFLSMATDGGGGYADMLVRRALDRLHDSEPAMTAADTANVAEDHAKEARVLRAKAEAHDKAVAMLHREFGIKGDPAKCHAVDAVVLAADKHMNLKADRDAARATGMDAVATVLGHDGEGDPVEYARAHVQEARAWESEALEYGLAMQRLGIDVPDDVTADAVVTAVHKAIQRTERESAFREHSINLHIVDHILRRVGGRIPNEPWPSDVDPDVVLERAHAAADGMMAIEKAIAKIGSAPAKRMIPNIVVVASAASSDADTWLLNRLAAKGIEAHLFQLNQAEGEARRTANRYGAPLLIVHEFDTNCARVMHVVESGQRFTVEDWLASVEVQS